MAGDSGSGKANALLNLTNQIPDVDKTFFYAKHPHEAKCTLKYRLKVIKWFKNFY